MIALRDITIREAHVVTVGRRAADRFAQRHPLAPAPGLTLGEAVLAGTGHYERPSDDALAAFLAAVDAERLRRGLPGAAECRICGGRIPVEELPAGARACSVACQAAFDAGRGTASAQDAT